MSDLDMDLVRGLHRKVGDEVQAHQSRLRGDGSAPLAGEPLRQFARSVITDVIRAHTTEQISAGGTPLSRETEQAVGDAIHARMFGAGALQRLLDDPSIENIDINGADEVWISRAGADAPERGAPVAASDEELVELVQTLASYSGLSSRAFDAANPELDLSLPDGSRLSGVMAVSDRPMISIRRHRLLEVTLADLVANDTLSQDVADFLAAVVRAKFSIVVSGGTNSGKTTLLRALASEIGPEERIVTIEKAFELGLRQLTARHPNCGALEARLPNSEGEGEFTVADLVKRTLRMNPSRVIVGEVLGDEIVPMLNAMSQGNDGSLSTIHSDRARETFSRISSYAQQAEGLPRAVVHEMIGGAVDFVVHIGRDRRGGGQRRVREILEVIGYDHEIGVASNAIFAPDEKGAATRAPTVEVARVEELQEAGWNPATPGWAGWSR